MATETEAVFFSYSRRDDSEFALRLAKDVKAAHVNVWMDQLNLYGGQRWAATIQEALEKCPVVLVILSPLSVNSLNVMNEVTFALEEGKVVVPVLLGDCKIPLQLRSLQHIDFRGDYQHGLEALLRTLGVPPESPPDEVEETVRAAQNAAKAARLATEARERDAAKQSRLEEERKAEQQALLEEERRRAAELDRLENERKQAAEQQRLEEGRKQAAEQSRLEEERKQAAEKARLEQEQRERAAAEKARQEELKQALDRALEEERKRAEAQVRLEQQRKQAAEQTWLEERRKQAAEQARLEEERRQSATERARQEQEVQGRQTERGEVRGDETNVQVETKAGVEESPEPEVVTGKPRTRMRRKVLIGSLFVLFVVIIAASLFKSAPKAGLYLLRDGRKGECIDSGLIAGAGNAYFNLEQVRHGCLSRDLQKGTQIGFSDVSSKCDATCF